MSKSKIKWWSDGWAPLIIVSALLIVAVLYIVFRKEDAPTTPVVPTASQPQYIYLADTLAPALLHQVDSLQRIVNAANAASQASQRAADFWKQKATSYENEITDVLNGNDTTVSTHAIANYFLRKLRYVR